MRAAVALTAYIGEFVTGCAGVLDAIAQLFALGTLDERLVAINGEIINLIAIAEMLIGGWQLAHGV